MPGPKARLLFGAPLAAMAAALARNADGQDVGMASAVPRVLAAAFACAAIAWMTSSDDVRKDGARSTVAGLSMAACAAMSLSFGAGLGVTAVRTGGFDLVTAIVMTFFLLLMAVTTLILAYVISTMMAVNMPTAAIVMTCQVVPLTALIIEPHPVAACGIALAAAAVAAQALIARLRAAKRQ